MAWLDLGFVLVWFGEVHRCWLQIVKNAEYVSIEMLPMTQSYLFWSGLVCFGLVWLGLVRFGLT